MTSRDFAYWLQGFFEIRAAGIAGNTSDNALTSAQVEIIQRHLAMVFIHEIDPSMPNPALDAAHKPPTTGNVPPPQPHLTGDGVWEHPNFKPTTAAAVQGNAAPYDSTGVLYRC